MKQPSISKPRDPSEVKTIQDFILLRLADLGKSQRWLAKEVGVSQAQLNNWLRKRVAYSAEWISNRASRLTAALNCEEAEIFARLEASIRRRSPSGTHPLNKQILRALVDDDRPTHDLMEMLQQVQRDVGSDLTYEACKELIKIAKNMPSE